MPNDVMQYHVSGEAPISVGTGVEGALEVLGISRDGVSIQILQRERAIKSDVGGSEVAVDYQRMGMEAFLDITLVSWKETVLRKLRNRPFVYPDGVVLNPAEGQGVPNGQLLGQSGGYFPVYIGAFFEDTWLFPTCKLLGQPQSVTVGTVASEYKLRFHGIVHIPGSIVSLTGLPSNQLRHLYERSLSGELVG